MSDVSSGARAPDLSYPTQPATESYSGGQSDQSTAKQVANQGAQAAGQAATEVKDTARNQAQRVGSEAKTQARNVASDVRDRVSEQARSQSDKLVGSIRQTADHLDEMRGDRSGSPAATVVSRVADGGRQLADYLESNGPEGVLREVTDFARRRPGAFLATALAAGFVVGRLGKGIAKADPDAGQSKPSSDSFVSGAPSYTDQAYTDQAYTDQAYTQPAYTDPGYTDPGYPATDYPVAAPATTEYAATGTGTPLIVEEYTEEGYTTGNPGGRP